MATRSTIGILNDNGTITEVYCHWDGYIGHNGYILNRYYKTEKQVRELLKGGAISSLGISPERISCKESDENYKNDDYFIRVQRKPLVDPNYDFIYNKFEYPRNCPQLRKKTVWNDYCKEPAYTYPYREDFGGEEYAYLFEPKTKTWKVRICGIRFGEKYVSQTRTLKWLFNEDDIHSSWLSSSQCNENGSSSGSFDAKKDKWVATVNPKGKPAEHFENVSHRKVAMWLEQKQREYGLA